MAKRKWYRISLSLAAKCRVGFALAVLLTIGAALLVPYRWMDRLLEQGKQELAQAEVQHLLERHFRQANDPAVSVDRPPLTIEAGQEKSIKPARWKELEGLSSSQGEKISVPVAEEKVSEETSVKEVIQDRPLAQWIRLPKGITQATFTEDLIEQMGSAVENVGTPEGSGQSTVDPQPTGTNRQRGATQPSGPDEALEQLPGDDFVRRGIVKFLRDRDQLVIFKLRDTGDSISQPLLNSDPPDDALDTANPDDAGAAQEEPQEKGPLERLLTQGEPGRYLRAVRADAGCLKSGCHGAVGSEAAESTGRTEGPQKFTEGELVGVISVILPAGQTSITLLFNRIFIVVAGLLASIIAVVTFYLITQRFILQPVRSLREAAAQVMVPTDETDENQVLTDDAALPQGQESWQAAMAITEKIRTGDEFERLAEAFNQMLGRLKLAHDRLRETNRALDLQLGELEAKNIALFESNKLKSEFLANVSHELRTPLNAIIGFAEIVQDQAQERADPKITRYAGNILTSGTGLLSVVNNLLDLARIEAGKVDVRWELCSVAEICEALLSFTRPLIEEKKLKVRLDVEKDLDLIETDGGKLQQVLFNLLSNAIKFTPKGGRIEIGATSMDQEYVQITVADTGVGIAEEERENIFEKFRQVDGSVTREHSGAGLGLAIVKDMLEILGGSIEVNSQAGPGTIFTVTLSKKRCRVSGRVDG